MKKILICIPVFLLLATGVFTYLHLSSRESVPEGCIAVVADGKTVYAVFEELPLEAVSGSIVNGKGVERPVEASGIEISALLCELGIDPGTVRGITVTADDEFSTKLNGGEINEEGKVYLAAGDEGCSLIVFGDKDAKRNVRNVVRLELG